MSTVRVIKKYPNRRLYDTEKSRYITLADVRELVTNEIDFAVIDKTSGEDITRRILLQVIGELEQQAEAIMSQEFLSYVIRSYGNAMPALIANYLEQSLRQFLAQPPGNHRPLQGGIPVEAVAQALESARHDFTRRKTLQYDLSRRLSGGTPANSEVDADALPEDRKKAS